LHFRGRAQLVRPAWLEHYAREAALVVSEAEPATPRDAQGAAVELAGCRVIGAAGIANPGDFFASLAQLGAQVVEAHAFADHHRYGGDDVAALIARAKGCKADAVVVTPKDAVKLVSQWPQGTPLWVLGTQPKILAGAEVLAQRLGVPNSLLVPANAAALSV
jgi:tetraacyldisaccharide-1-P 4'-kinase